MATFDYAELAGSVDLILQEFGRELVYGRQLGSTTFDPSTLAATTEGSANYSVTIADFDYETQKGGMAFIAQEGGPRIEVGDRQAIMSPKTADGSSIAWEPKTGDTLVVNTEIWKVIRLEQKIAPADVPVAFILQIRKGGA